MSKEETQVGLSLSGGGFRATLYSLGVLYYFVDSGLAKSLRAVVSVSGGSVANAFVAQECDLTTVTSNEFESIIRRMARTIATTGFLRTVPAILWGLSLAAVLIATIISVVVLPTPLLRLLALGIAVAAFGLTIHLRGFALGRAMKQTFFSSKGRATTLSDLERGRVRHVLVATEMTSGQPIFFEGRTMHGPALPDHYGESSSVPVHLAVRCSCTVPGLLPPETLDPTRIRFRRAIDDGSEPKLRSTLILMDGGVSNNLATDFLAISDSMSFGTRKDPLYIAPVVEQWLVVDASGRLGTVSTRFAKVPLVGELVSFARSISILYENTISPRRGHVPIISIARSPTMQKLNAIGSSSQLRRYSEVDEYFREHFETHHEEQALFEELPSITSRVPTTFDRIDEETIACLLWHGYMSALSVSYGISGWAPPKSLCGRTIHHFRKLVSGSPESVRDPWARIYHTCDLTRTIKAMADRDA